MTNEFIPVANAFLGKEEAQAAYDAITSGWISFLGSGVKKFEEEFAKTVQAKHAIAVSNGTAALHTALAALGIGKGDEVIVPTITFVSTANAVLYQDATPVLANCDSATYNVTAEEIERLITPKTKAIIPVDMNGMPVDYDAILAVADKYNIPVIADSAESLGATYKGRPIGGIAPIHIFSFFANKNITTGEGGMITTSDKALAEKMRIIMNQGQEERYKHTELGYNYRMTNIQAVIGLEQLKRLPSIVSAKQRIAEIYTKALANVTTTPHVPDYVTQHAWYMYTISVDETKRDTLVKALQEANIQTRLSFPPVHRQPYYKKRFNYPEGFLSESETAWKKLINIPIWKGMEHHQMRIIQTLISLL